MLKDNFRQWLIKKKSKSEKHAGDIVSRCNRIEKVFEVSLDSNVSSSAKLDQLLDRISNEAKKYLKPGSNVITAAGQLRSAARLYSEYLASKK